jgi:hypothetical protein
MPPVHRPLHIHLDTTFGTGAKGPPGGGKSGKRGGLPARWGGRRQRVEALAHALAEEFRDPGSVRFYAHLLWGALRLEDYGLRQGALEVLAWAIGRVREAVATAEFSRRKVLRPGALLASLLKAEGLLDQIRQAPHRHSAFPKEAF